MSTSIFVGCFDYFNSDTEEQGHFQLVVEAPDALTAAAKCRARLDALADTSDALGPVDVHLDALVRLPAGGITDGVLVHMRRFPDDSGISMYDPLPFRNAEPGEVLFSADLAVGSETQAATADAGGESQAATEPPFWSDVERFREKWKLFWCETEDHDEDWFVVARSPEEAAEFHESAEGYDEDEATAELVCALPASEQKGHSEPYWPDDRTLFACGAEFLPYAPQDGHDELRQQVGTGGRVVRLKGNVYGEGDIVSNTLQRLGLTPES
jgi:hypothetical protein